MEPSRRIAWDHLRVAIPSFVTIVLVPYWTHYGIFVGMLVDGFLGLVLRFFSCTASGTPERTPQISHALSCLSVSVGLSETEKLQRARQLLHDLGPPPTNRARSETWEIDLRLSLARYIEGTQSMLNGRTMSRPGSSSNLAMSLHSERPA